MDETPIVPGMFKLTANLKRDLELSNVLARKIQEKANKIIEAKNRDSKKELNATIKLQNIMVGRDLGELVDGKIRELVEKTYAS